MPPYSLIHMESALWVLCGGLIFAAAIVLGRASRRAVFSFRRRSEDELEQETHEFGGIISEQNRPVPLLIWLMGIGCLIWAVLYVVFSGTKGL